MLADSQKAPITPMAHVRPALLLGLGALLNCAALEELLANTHAWPFPAGARLFFLVVAALVVRNVGRRIHWRPATAYLVGSLGVLLALVAQW